MIEMAQVVLPIAMVVLVSGAAKMCDDPLRSD